MVLTRLQIVKIDDIQINEIYDKRNNLLIGTKDTANSFDDILEIR